MSYRITRNSFAPKATHSENIDIEHNSHGIIYLKCNFRCEFCCMDFENFKKYIEYDEFSFTAAVLRLMQSGKNFKFSGGESTLNPNLKRDLQIVKKLGGTVFLDSNGSNPEVIKDLLNEGLIDVLGISLKGLSKEDCMKTANIKNGDLCWKRTFETIAAAAAKPEVKVIVTHVCFDNVDMAELERFAELLAPYKNVYYKINNLLGKPEDSNLKKIDSDYLVSLLNEFKIKYPQWEGKIIYIDTIEGMSQHNKILFL